MKAKQYCKKKGLLLVRDDREYEHHTTLHLGIWPQCNLVICYKVALF